MNKLASLMLKRIESQPEQFQSRTAIAGNPAITLNFNALPFMTETTDWGVSGTRRWNKEALSILQEDPAADLGKDFAEFRDPWVCMAAIAELAMHGEDSRAREFARALFQADVDAEPLLLGYFGQEIINSLKENDSEIV